MKPALIFKDDGFWDAIILENRCEHSELLHQEQHHQWQADRRGFRPEPRGRDYNFAVSHDRVWSSGFVLDFTEVLALVL